jgi:hypothetical protein
VTVGPAHLHSNDTAEATDTTTHHIPIILSARTNLGR